MTCDFVWHDEQLLDNEESSQRQWIKEVRTRVPTDVNRHTMPPARLGHARAAKFVAEYSMTSPYPACNVSSIAISVVTYWSVTDI